MDEKLSGRENYWWWDSRNDNPQTKNLILTKLNRLSTQESLKSREVVLEYVQQDEAMLMSVYIDGRGHHHKQTCGGKPFITVPL